LKTEKLRFLLTLVLIGMTTQVVRAQQARVFLAPPSYTVSNVGLTFNVNVTIENVDDLYAWEIKLYYPNDILNATAVAEGPFLKTGGMPTFLHLLNFTDNYSATHGLLHVFCSRVGNVSGISGNGTLAAITLKSIATDGPKALHLDDVKLSNPNPGQIAYTTADGEVAVVPEFATALILPMLMILTLSAIIFRKKTRTKL